MPTETLYELNFKCSFGWNFK